MRHFPGFLLVVAALACGVARADEASAGSDEVHVQICPSRRSHMLGPRSEGGSGGHPLVRAMRHGVMGFAREWDEKPGNKFSRLHVTRDLDMYDEANWPSAHQWLLDHLIAARDAFRPRVALLDDGPAESAP